MTAAPRRTGTIRLTVRYLAVAIAAAAVSAIAQRGGAPAWLGYLGSAIVVIVSIAWIETRRRTARARADDPDLRLFHADAPRERLLALLAALERAERPRAGVGVGIPPGTGKLWIRHVEGAFEVHVFAVSAADGAQLERMIALLKRSAAVRAVASGAPRVAAFRAVLGAGMLNGIVVQMLEDERTPSATRDVQLWWSVTLGDAPG